MFTALDLVVLSAPQALAHGIGGHDDGVQGGHGGQGGRVSAAPRDGLALNVGREYDNCYIDMHEGLSHADFRRFNREFASGYAFTSLSGPRTLGDRRFQLTLISRPIAIDDSSDAWNDTWSHLDEEHWLGLVALPILQMRARVDHVTDVEAMFSFGMANWYIGGLGLRHHVVQQDDAKPVDVDFPSANWAGVSLILS